MDLEELSGLWTETLTAAGTISKIYHMIHLKLRMQRQHSKYLSFV